MSLYYFKVYGLLLEYWLSNSSFVDFLNLYNDKELFIFWGSDILLNVKCVATYFMDIAPLVHRTSYVGGGARLC